MSSTATAEPSAPPTGHVDPATQRIIEELREVTARITAADAEMNRMAVKRTNLMLDLHDAGFKVVHIAAFMGLTRQRVSTLLAPAIKARLVERVNGKK